MHFVIYNICKCGVNRDAKLIDKLIPSIMLGGADEITYPILAIQVNTFLCGGIRLGVSISHRVADTSTLCTFLNEWAVMNREDNEVELTGTADFGFGKPIWVTMGSVPRKYAVFLLDGMGGKGVDAHEARSTQPTWLPRLDDLQQYQLIIDEHSGSVTLSGNENLNGERFDNDP
ncbi:hypothetical protein L2E82_16232 [Cichorium intybus]|uniref:Uncharacterized protein n=1 Tax=Cichorium intybus TaxID=13427 RepID=A0ACB9F5H7_CICIN|nr:hypothetical protein L2E82_16232 [Cichorium intybus]